MIPGSVLLKNLTPKSIYFRHFFSKITFSVDFDNRYRKKKGTIGKYRWFPVDWPLYGGSSIAKKSFARPRHFGFFSIFVAENQKMAFSGIWGEGDREALEKNPRKRHIKDQMICDLGSAHNREVNYNPLLAVPPLTLSAPTPSNRGENDPDLGLQRAKIRNLGLKVTEVFQGFPGFYTANR